MPAHDKRVLDNETKTDEPTSKRVRRELDLGEVRFGFHDCLDYEKMNMANVQGISDVKGASLSLMDDMECKEAFLPIDTLLKESKREESIVGVDENKDKDKSPFIDALPYPLPTVLAMDVNDLTAPVTGLDPMGGKETDGPNENQADYADYADCSSSGEVADPNLIDLTRDDDGKTSPSPSVHYGSLIGTVMGESHFGLFLDTGQTLTAFRTPNDHDINAILLNNNVGLEVCHY